MNGNGEGRPIPRVSIGVPVYNGEQFLEAALESLRSQTVGDFEVVISDNGSTDGTEEICRQFVAMDSRFRYIRQVSNRGAAWNFNEVFRLANAPYFKWATHDDLLAPEFLQACVEALDSAPDTVVLCYPKTVMIDADDTHIMEFEDRLDIRGTRASDRFEQYLENYVLSNAIFGLHRTEVLRRTRLLGAYVSSDLVLFSEIVLLGEIWEIPERLFYRRWHFGMSRLANVTNKEVTAWFDPLKSGDRIMPRNRLVYENVRAIFHIPLPAIERNRSLRTLVRVWFPRYWRTVGGEWKRELMRSVGLRNGS